MIVSILMPISLVHIVVWLNPTYLWTMLWGSKILYQMSRREDRLIPCFVYSSIGKYSTARKSRNAQLESTLYHITQKPPSGLYF